MKKFCLVILILATIVGTFFFNAWYIQKLYEIGLIPLMSLFNVTLPIVSYKAFIVISFFISCVYTIFKYDSKKTNKSVTINDFDDGVSKFMGDIFGMILTKLLKLLILCLLISMIF